MSTSFTGALYSKLDAVNYTVVIGEYEWELHKSKIASKSNFFEAMIASGFKAREHPVMLISRQLTWGAGSR